MNIEQELYVPDSLGELYGAEMAPHMYYGPVAHIASLQSMAAVRSFLIQEWDAAMEPVFTSMTRGTFPVAKNGRASGNSLTRRA